LILFSNNSLEIIMRKLSAWLDKVSSNAFILPAILVVLALSVFPLIISLYMSLTRFKFVKGGFEFEWIGFDNYKKLLVGSEQTHFLGKMGAPSPIGWLIFGAVVIALTVTLVRYTRSPQRSIAGTIGRIIASVALGLAFWLLIHTLNAEGRPGTMVVTWIFVYLGIAVQYSLGLGLALLTTQRIPGRRFFRVVYLLPMMITPVGVAYMFRMLTDTDKGPFQPIWQAMGLGLYSWVTNPWGARVAIMLGDIWQWTPFMFIVLLAALEGQSVEQVEAALVDGANRWQIFWNITLPNLLPVSITLVLIRMIEAFKIVDLPNIMTNGGPGTATESMTLHAFFSWRSLNLGQSAAISYILLIVVTLAAMTFINLFRGRAVEAL
jgi:multiple sugar transport system permease protein